MNLISLHLKNTLIILTLFFKLKKILNMKMIFVFILSTILFTACEKNDPISTQTLTLDPYTGVSVQRNIKVTIRYGTTPEVRLTGSTNFLDRMDLRVENNTLIIRRDEGTYIDFNVEVLVIVPTLNFVELTSSNNIDISAFTLSEDLTLRVTNSGNINTGYLNLSANRLNIEITGDGNISTRGKAAQSDILITGSGDYDGYEMIVDDSDVHINDSGNAKVNVLSELRAFINSTGNVYYKGQPNISQNNSNGAGMVIDAN